jgi:hypothetical protein
MSIRPGFRLVVAPHFHLDVDWSKRLALGAGVEQTAGGLMALSPWRPADPGEQEQLVLDTSRPTPREESSRCLCLFGAPVHLRSSFQDLLGQMLEQGTMPADGFAHFTALVARFLDFKGLPAPAGAVFDLVVSPPEQRAVLALDLWGLINLGEETASVVFLNVPAGDIPEAGYPPVRLELLPGEGVRAPAGMPFGCQGSEGGEPDLLLLIRPPSG